MIGNKPFNDILNQPIFVIFIWQDELLTVFDDQIKKQLLLFLRVIDQHKVQN